MNTTLIRAGVGLGTVGGVVGGGYFLNQQLSTETIEKKLIANKYELLGNESEEWTKVLENYKTTVGTKKDLQFGDFTGEPKEETKLKEECKKAIEKLSSDKDSYKKAEHWCTKPRTLTDVLQKEGLRLLITEENQDSKDQDEWNKKLDAYVKETTESKKFNGIQIPKAGTDLKKDKKERDEIKKKCKELDSKKHYESDFDSNLEKAKLWCAIENKDKK